MNQMNTAAKAISNNAAQDGEQRCVALRRRNHEEKKTQKKKFDICVNHLFVMKEMKKKMQRGDYR
jgi:hypothetical protein